MGCTSIYSAIHFIPLRGLDFNGETKVIRLYVIPQIQQKALQTAKPCLNHPADWCLFTKSVAELPFCSLTSFYRHPKLLLQVSDPSCCWATGYLYMGTIWKEDSVCLKDCPEEALCTPDVLPAKSFFCSSLTPPPPNYYFLTVRPASRRNFRQRSITAFQHFVYTHISEPNANVVHFPHPFCLVKCVLMSVSNPKNRKMCQKKYD